MASRRTWRCDCALHRCCCPVRPHGVSPTPGGVASRPHPDGVRCLGGREEFSSQERPAVADRDDTSPLAPDAAEVKVIGQRPAPDLRDAVEAGTPSWCDSSGFVSQSQPGHQATEDQQDRGRASLTVCARFPPRWKRPGRWWQVTCVSASLRVMDSDRAPGRRHDRPVPQTGQLRKVLTCRASSRTSCSSCATTPAGATSPATGGHPDAADRQARQRGHPLQQLHRRVPVHADPLRDHDGPPVGAVGNVSGGDARRGRASGWSRGSTRSPNCSRTQATRHHCGVSGISVRSRAGCRLTRASTSGGATRTASMRPDGPRTRRSTRSRRPWGSSRPRSGRARRAEVDPGPRAGPRGASLPG